MLPLTTDEVEFCPKMYNYQSAVLVITSCSQGTSCQVMSNKENLYFNRNGEKVKYLAKRLQQDRKERGVELKGEMTDSEKDRNVIIIYQIPLINKMASRSGTLTICSGVNMTKNVNKSFGYINCSGSGSSSQLQGVTYLSDIQGVTLNLSDIQGSYGEQSQGYEEEDCFESLDFFESPRPQFKKTSLGIDEAKN